MEQKQHFLTVQVARVFRVQESFTILCLGSEIICNKLFFYVQWTDHIFDMQYLDLESITFIIDSLAYAFGEDSYSCLEWKRFYTSLKK